MNTFLVVLPTYNESENIERLVHELLATGLPLDILVVDDASPDGTGRIADKLSRAFSQVTVMHRPSKGGLASAYAEGFSYALEVGYPYIIQMDADFSHHPRYLHALSAHALSHDLVVASRYVDGGGTIGWPWYRKLLSRAASRYAQTVLGTGVQDATSGFRLWSRELLASVMAQPLTTAGFAVQLETLYRAVRAGANIREIPIVFAERAFGRSKLSPEIISEALVCSVRMRIIK